MFRFRKENNINRLSKHIFFGMSTIKAFVEIEHAHAI
jgi:hypothetical protein